MNREMVLVPDNMTNPFKTLDLIVKPGEVEHTKLGHEQSAKTTRKWKQPENVEKDTRLSVISHSTTQNNKQIVLNNWETSGIVKYFLIEQ